MSVVLRCPNCGTTRETPGECEACREATVRYFCTNHTPGIWIAERTCPTCGTRFGERARSVPVPAPVVALRSPTPARKSAPVSVPGPASAPRRAPRPRAETPRSGAPPPTDEELESSGAYLAPWQRALSAVLEARRSAIVARRGDLPAVGLGGCLRRLLLTALFLILALGTAIFFFGRALLSGLQP